MAAEAAGRLEFLVARSVDVFLMGNCPAVEQQWADGGGVRRRDHRQAAEYVSEIRHGVEVIQPHALHDGVQCRGRLTSAQTAEEAVILPADCHGSDRAP